MRRLPHVTDRDNKRRREGTSAHVRIHHPRNHRENIKSLILAHHVMWISLMLGQARKCINGQSGLLGEWTGAGISQYLRQVALHEKPRIRRDDRA